ncbi:hemagglutinin repeat-containing protein [Paraburkholderia sacchari]|uniref:Filamentous hemagglutinin N-terminal domain-containing protein n=1 Tax=Paraburkholderia sacchari TaxID=159450 RepID=A0A8T6ZJM2_9BURK|nr:hemagglutinin repeat-containing protein [Paraburkholderia sacchari]NLP65387.1 filamentous hemagglutinin N-terminal domain-containing protein [Paraburkholderia sacchari]
MNRCYRLVYSRARNMLVAVEETATAAGKTGETRVSGRTSSPVYLSLRRLLPAVLLALVPMLTFAQIVAGGAHAPNVIQTQNGLDQVNINRPSGAGVSVNTFNRFDVPGRGAILNNSPTIVQTQQAGMINGNPNFSAGQSARIIVNQVNSANASQLNGFLETAGNRAEVIIANPSGISVNGGGFINTSRAILTTGTPNYAADGSVSGFNVTGGNITVSGAGLNASNVDQVDLLARAVQANAAIYAKNLNVITGANSIDHDTLSATPIAGDSPAPGVSIDVSNLGGMYANRVFLVGTEAGVGVSLKGIVAANAGDLVLTTQGKLVLASQANASGNINVSARDGIDNSGTTYAQQNVSLGTGGALTNSGLVGAQQNTAINAGAVNSTGTLAAGLNSDGSLAQSGDLNMSASGAVRATGRNAAGGNANISGATVNLAGSSTSANGAMTLAANGGDLNLSGATTTAGGTLDARASGTLNNDNGAMSSGGAQTVTAGALSNRGGQMISGGALTGNVAGATNNQGGTMQASGALSVASGSLENSGGHIASLGTDGVSLTTTGLLNNGTGATIGGNGNVTLQAGQIANAGSITAVQSLIASAAQTVFNGGVFAANANMALTAGSTLTNTSQLSANGGLSIAAATFDNSGASTRASQFTLHAGNLLNRGGTIAQSGTGATTLDVSGTLDNTNGSLQTNADSLALGPAALLNDHGTITNSGAGTLVVNTGVLSNNGGTIVTNGTLNAHVSGALSNVGGTLQAAKQLTADAGSIDNTAGHIVSLGTDGLSIHSAGALNNGAGGSIGGNGDVALQAGQIANAGSVTAVQSLIATAVQTLFNSGTFASNGNLTLSAGTTLTNNSQFSAGRTLYLSTATFDNSHGTISADQLALRATNLLNRGGTIAQSGTGGTTVDVTGTLDNTGGTLQTNAESLMLGPAALLNDHGTITSAGTDSLALDTGTLSNNGGTIATNGALSAHVSGAQSNVGGTMQAAKQLSVNSGSLDNSAGRIVSLGTDGVSVATTGLLNNGTAGSIAGNGNVALQAGQIANAGSITAVQNLIATAVQTLFNGGTFAANGNMTLTAGTTLTNAGQFGAGHALVLSAATFDNSGATVSAGQFTLHAADFLNRVGSVTQTGTGATTLDVSGTFDNTNGSLLSNADNLALGAASLVNDDGTIANAGTGTLSASAGTLSNNRGAMATNGTLDVHAGAVANRGGTMAAQSGAMLTLASLDNSAGGYIGAKSVTVTDAGALDNTDGTIQADETLKVSAQSVANDAGAIANGGAGETAITASSVISNTRDGLIGGNGDVLMSGGSVENSGGTVTAGGAALVQSASTLGNRAGIIQGMGATVAAGGAIDNSGGQIEADGVNSALTVSGATLDNSDGRIANTGIGATTITAGTITNSNAGGVTGAGTIGGNGNVSVNAQTLSNTNGAQLLSGHDLTLDIGQFADNTSATLSGANNVTLNGPNAALVNVGGSVHGNGAVMLDTASVDNTSGRIGNDTDSGGSIAIHTGALANQGGAIGSDQNLSVTTNTLTGDGRIIAGNDGALTVNGDYTLNSTNKIQANHNLAFTTAGAFTNLGTLGAVNALTVNAASVDNQAGADLNSTDTTVNAAGAISNAGRIEGDSVTTNSASLSNIATIVGNTVTLNAGSIANTGAAAALAAASTLNLYSPGDISNTGGATIFSLGDINIAADATRGANGVLAKRAGSVTNDQSTIEALGDIQIAAQTLTNTRPAPLVETVMTDVETIHQTKRDKYMPCTVQNADPHTSCTQPVWAGPYQHPLNATFDTSQIVTEGVGPAATDRVLIVNVNGQQQTIYYNTLTANGDGTITVSYWDDYDPHINFDPATEYPGDNQAHNHYQRVEVARDTTTTTQLDQIAGPQAQQAQIMAGGNLVLANVGSLNNEYSAIGAGNAIQIGSATANGDVASGNYGGTLVNNIGQTLYQYQRQDIVSTYAWNEDISRDRGTVAQPSIILAPVAIGGTGGAIIANNAVQINATDINNTNVAAASSATGATGGTLGANGAIATINGGSQQTVNGAGGGTSVNAQSGNAAGTVSGGASVSGQSGTAASTVNGGQARVDAPQSVAGPTGALNIPLPSGGIYTVNPAPGASYLVVTDPKLTSYASFISSDYMLGALGLDPSRIIKRLGDGLYEQQLVRNQITQLTGRAYMQGYKSNEDEYRALMNNGVNVAKAFSLSPGIALTAAQMDALTSDIVWMVNQTVTLPDGSTQTVLAPVVYLAHTHANDLQPTGALIAADDVEIHAAGSATNSGVIKGGTQTVISATNIVNRGGAIGSSSDNGTTVLSASNDIVNASGRITGNRVAVLAGHDIVNTTLVDNVAVTSVAGSSKVTQTLVGAQGVIASTGDMVVAAGNDLTVHGANILAGGDARIAAGHDINVDAVGSHTTQSVTTSASNFTHAESTLNQSSSIASGGSLAMQSGNDMTFRGANVSAGTDLAVVAGGNLTATTVTNSASNQDVTRDSKTRNGEDRSYDEQAVGTTFKAGGSGTVAALSTDASKGNVTLTGSSLTTGTGAASIAATGNVDINEAREEHDRYSAVEFKRGSFVHGSTTNQMQNTQANVGVGSTVSGDSVSVQSGKNLTVAGSTIAGTNDVNLAAAGNVTITTSQDTQNSQSYYSRHESGIGTSGLSLTIGSSSQENTGSGSSVTNNASTVGSIGGNLTVRAGKDLRVSGSDLIAARNITGTGENVTIDAATDTSQRSQTQKTHSSGLTIGLAGSLGDAINNAYSESQAASHSASTGNDRASALHAIAAAGDAGMAGAMAKDAVTKGGAPDIGIKVSVGSSSSRSDSSESQTTNRGSNVNAGGTAAFVATGNDTPGSGNVTIAGSNVSANDVLLDGKNQVNVTNTTDTDSTRSSNSSSSASVGVQYTLGGGFGISAAMSNAHGDANSDASIQNASHVTGANSVTVISGGDTNVTGSQIAGRQISADVGGNLNVTSVQDTTTSAAHQSSSGGGFTITQYGGASASVTAQKGHADGSYAGVNEQAGLYAGDGGFDVNVKGNTALTGAVISSTADAAKNSLTTGTLAYSDLENHSHYSANSIGGSYGVAASTGSAGKSVGPGSVPGTGGFVPMIPQNDSGDQSATTRSAVSAGTVNITDGANQKQDVGSLSRDTANTNGKVANAPDVNDMLNKQADTMQAAQAAGQAVAQGIGAYADMKRDAAEKAVEAAADSNDPQAMAAALADYANWREGGDARAALQAGGGALVGGLGGGAFGAIGGAAGAALSSKLADQTRAATDAVTDATGSSLIGNIGGNILSGLAGALVGGGAGAAAASNVNLYNEGKDPEAAAKDARVKGIVERALGNAPDFNPVSLGTLIDQFIGQVKSGAQAKMSEAPSALAAQGVANGINAGIGIGGGVPPAASPGAVLVNGAGQALSSGAGSAAYQPDNATLNVQDNRDKGRAFEAETVKTYEQQNPEVVQEVTVKVADGTKTRLDIVTRDANGNIGCVECKSSDTAPLTPNQTAAFPQIETGGAVVVGKGKPGFPGGTVIPPTKVDIVRPVTVNGGK